MSTIREVCTDAVERWPCTTMISVGWEALPDWHAKCLQIGSIDGQLSQAQEDAKAALHLFFGKLWEVGEA